MNARALLLALVCCLPLAAQEPEQVQAALEEAYALCVRGQEQGAEGRPALERACARYAEVLAQVEGLQISGQKKALVRQIAHYNTACARSLLGEVDAGLEALKQALEAGYDDLARLGADESLAALRQNPRFHNLLARTRAKLDGEAAAAAQSVLSPEALFPFAFEVTTLDGATLSLDALRGKVVIVDYWGTWCGPCRQEIPHLIELQREFGDLLVIVGMTYERTQGAEAEAGVRRFAKELGIPYALVMADRGLLEKVPNLEGFPTTLFLDAQGRVRAKEVGYREHGYLRQLVLALLAEQAGGEAPETPAPEEPAPEEPGIGPF
ncbi:MAG: TlpA disulfide reductase family protein [Planctomycetota bacterium]